MTPKEKAEELINKFQQDVQIIEEDNDSERFYAKQCALIAVDEIIKIEKQRYFDYNNLTQLITGFKTSADFDENLIHIREKQLKSDSVTKLMYWTDVRKEIEAL